MSGTVRPVLWEHPLGKTGLMTGLTDNYLRINAPLHAELLNSVTQCRIGAPADGESMTGTPILLNSKTPQYLN